MGGQPSAKWLLISRETHISTMRAQACKHTKGLICIQMHTLIKQIIGNGQFNALNTDTFASLAATHVFQHATYYSRTNTEGK